MALQVGNVWRGERVEAPKAVYIQANIEQLDYPLIPFAVLKQDPLVLVKRYLEQHLSKGQEIGEGVLYDAWNSPFAGLGSEQLFFLYTWAAIPEVSSAILRTMGLVFIIASPGPSHMRWLTTRPVRHQGELVAWCIPVNMQYVEHEKIERVLFSEENILRFSSPDWLC